MPGSVPAEEIHFDASIDRNSMSLGQSAQLALKFEGIKNIPAPELPAIEGLQLRYIGPSTMMSIVNGSMSSSITHIYRLIPLKTGTFRIDPLSFEHKGNAFISNEVSIEIVDSPARQGVPSESPRRMDTAIKDRLFLEIETGKSRAYINEILPLSIKLYVSGLSIRDIQYPEIDLEGFSAGEFGKPLQYKAAKNGISYDVVEFKTSLFGTKPGEFELGPARLKANLLLKRQSGGRSSPFNDFFGRDPFEDFFGSYRAEPVDVTSDYITLTVMPLPHDTKPDGFQGAIGTFDVTMDVSPKELKTGDPLTLKIIITGSGNFSTVTMPQLEDTGNFKIYEPKVVQEDNKKTFEQVLIPLNESVKEVPAVSFSFFNSETGRYQTLSKGPVPVAVTKPDKKDELTIVDAQQASTVPPVQETLGRDIIYIKESPGTVRRRGSYLYNNGFFLLLHTVPLFLTVTALLLKRKKDRLRTDIGYARRLKAPKKAAKGIREAELFLQKNRTEEFYDSVFRTIREYIGNRFHVAPGGITADVVNDTLKNKGIDNAILDTIQIIFNDCDMARYAPAEFNAARMHHTLKALKESIDSLERTNK